MPATPSSAHRRAFLTRAGFLQFAAGGLTVFLGSSTRRAMETTALADAPETGMPAPVRIMLATDMHYLSPRLNDHGAYFQRMIAASDAKVTEYCDELMDAFVDLVLDDPPEALVIPGDLTLNGAIESHEDLAAKLAPIRKAETAVLVIPGNHDVYSNQAARFVGDGFELVPSATREDFERIWYDFGYTGGLAYDETSASYVWRLVDGTRLLFVDVNAVECPGFVPASTLAWVATQLDDARDAGEHVLAFSHQNLLQQAFIDYGYSIGNADELRALYETAGVRVNFSGHLHAQHYAIAESGLIDIATSSLAVTPNQWANIETSGDWLGYRTFTLGEKVSDWARTQNIENPDLLDFEDYARSFFEAKTHDSSLAAYKAAGATNAEELADYMCAVNLGFFSGRLDLLEPRPDLVDQIESLDPLTGFYLRFVLGDDEPKNENEVDVDLNSRSSTSF